MTADILAVPLPSETVHITTDAVTEQFWLAARERRLVAQRCADCGGFRLPPTPFCPQCRSTRFVWPELSGAGTVYSFTIVHGYPGVPHITLVPAVIELPDAPNVRLVTNVVGVDPVKIHIGMKLRVDFHPIADRWLLPVFRPGS